MFKSFKTMPRMARNKIVISSTWSDLKTMFIS